MDETLRMDLLLHRLCLARSRNEAKTACDAGAVLVGESIAKPSTEVAPGAVVTVRYPHRTLVFELDQIPPKSTSRKAAREMYRVVSDAPAPGF